MVVVLVLSCGPKEIHCVKYEEPASYTYEMLLNILYSDFLGLLYYLNPER